LVKGRAEDGTLPRTERQNLVGCRESKAYVARSAA
jgi:hypothetical protein